MAKTNRRKLKQKKFKLKRAASSAGEDGSVCFLPRSYVVLILLTILIGASFVHLTAAQTPQTKDDEISAIADISNNNKVSEKAFIANTYKYASPSSKIGKPRSITHFNRERRAKAKAKAKAKPSKQKGKLNPLDDGDKCNIDLFRGHYFYSGGCGGMSFNLNITCGHDEDEKLCKVQERSTGDECGFSSPQFIPEDYIHVDESGLCTLGHPAPIPFPPRDMDESCAKKHPTLSVKFIAKKVDSVPAEELDIYFSDDDGETFREEPLTGHYQPGHVFKRALRNGKDPLVAFHEESQRRLSCHAPGMKVIFVTSTTYTGNLGGVAGADVRCQRRAIAAGLDGSFKAWLSNSNYSPAANWFQNGGHPYHLPDGTKVADDWGDLVDQILYHEINVNEFGQTVPSNPRVWTSTNWNGFSVTNSVANSCSNWNSGSDTDEGIYGSINQKNHQWSWYGRKPCNWKAHLYCVQHFDLKYELRTDLSALGECPNFLGLTEEECQEATGEMALDGVFRVNNWDTLPCGCFLWQYPDFAKVIYDQGQAGCLAAPTYNLGMICLKSCDLDCRINRENGLKVIFVTSTTYTGNFGNNFSYGGNGDDICQARANDAGLRGRYFAWSHRDGYDSSWWWGNYPYYLPDGTKVADNWNHLTNARDQNLHHQINVNEFGQTVIGNARVWTGKDWDGSDIRIDLLMEEGKNTQVSNCHTEWSFSGFDLVDTEVCVPVDSCRSGNYGGAWLSSDVSSEGIFGSINQKDERWTWYGHKPCNWEARLYCVQKNVLQ